MLTKKIVIPLVDSEQRLAGEHEVEGREMRPIVYAARVRPALLFELAIKATVKNEWVAGVDSELLYATHQNNVIAACVAMFQRALKHGGIVWQQGAVGDAIGQRDLLKFVIGTRTAE